MSNQREEFEQWMASEFKLDPDFIADNRTIDDEGHCGYGDPADIHGDFMVWNAMWTAWQARTEHLMPDGWEVKLLSEGSVLSDCPEYHISNGEVSAGVGWHYTNPAYYHFINDVLKTKQIPNESAIEQHPDDIAVDKFAQTMKTKLAEARKKGKGGWDDRQSCSSKLLMSELWFHLFKGNEGTFEDIANFAMMLHQRGDSPEELAQMAEHLTKTIPPLEQVDKPEELPVLSQSAWIAKYGREFIGGSQIPVSGAPISLPEGFVKKQKFDLLVAEAKRIEDMQAETINKLRDDLRTAYLHQEPNENEPVWYWQGDGYDHLESLVGDSVVVIRADQLRALLASEKQS